MSKSLQNNILKNISVNRQASFNYHIEERIEAGIILQGSELKSLRNGKANINDAHASIDDNELFFISKK